ncbi:MAG: OPT/YSL family transporter [Candidatus Bathyarchaeia archaeon]
MEKEYVYEPALTWKVLLAILFGCVIIQPGLMYLYLVSGWALPLSTWLVILLWTEFSRLLGSPMKKQEIFIIMSFQWTAISGAWLFLNPIRNLYFIQSKIPTSFGIIEIPWWWAPINELEKVTAIRTFFDPAWIFPIFVMLIVFALELIASISVGYLAYQIFVVEQKLEFPSQSASAITIVTLAERETKRMRVLTTAALVGMIYAIFSFLIPYFTGGIGSSPLQFLPRGWRDITYLIEPLVPGGIMGLDTTLFTFITGFIVPLPVLTLMLITSLGIYLIGNHFIIPQEYGGFGLWPEWRPGMPMLLAISRSQLYVWISVAIGFSLAAAFIPLLLRPKMIIRAFSGLKKISEKERPLVPWWALLIIFFGATLTSVVLTHFLIPGFPIWILALFSVGFSFFASFLSASASGITFGGMSIPYLRESIIYFSGYRNLDIWFANYITWGTSPYLNLQAIGGLAWVASPPMAGLPLIVDGGGVTGAFKMADIVQCSKREYILAVLIVSVLGWSMSFIYSSIFWKVAPIPSSAYPYTVTGWATEVIERCRWVNWLWTGILFNSNYISISFLIGLVVTVISNFANITYAPVAIAAGILTPMPVVISQFIGCLIGNFIKSKIGQDKWLSYRPLIVTGFIIGDGVILTLTVATTLISKAQWVLPY